jgi:GNAT superfamily N-acetyltransferase
MTLALAAMSAVPSLRRLVVRRTLAFAEADVASATLKIADTADEVLGAAAVLHDSYVTRGLLEPHPSGYRVTAHGVLPGTQTLVAKIDGRVIGAISLVKDGPLGLPLEGVYRDEVEHFRARGEKLAEVGSLAIAPEHRNKGLVQLLYRYVFDVAMARGVDRFVIAVHPRSENAYRVPLLFDRFGPERRYPGLNSCASSVGLTAGLADLPERMRVAFGEEESTGNPYYVYYSRTWDNLAPITRKPLGGVQHRVLARTLVAARPDVFEELSPSVLGEMRRELPGVPLPRGTGAAMRLTPSWWTSQFAPT